MSQPLILYESAYPQKAYQSVYVNGKYDFVKHRFQAIHRPTVS